MAATYFFILGILYSVHKKNLEKLAAKLEELLTIIKKNRKKKIFWKNAYILEKNANLKAIFDIKRWGEPPHCYKAIKKGAGKKKLKIRPPILNPQKNLGGGGG